MIAVMVFTAISDCHYIAGWLPLKGVDSAFPCRRLVGADAASGAIPHQSQRK